MRRLEYAIFIIILIIQCSHVRVVLATRSPGETYPNNIEIRIGDSTNITCRINLSLFQGNDSTSLHFIENDTGRELPRDDIVIINDSTIVLMLRNASAQNRNYLCKSGDNGIGLTHVSVGTPPLDIVDFQCRGYDFTYIVCNFTIPENMVLTQYNLTYMTSSANYLQPCQLDMQETQAICNLTLDKGNYRTSYELYNFTLTGYNVIGQNIQSFLINHFESVIPAKPDYHIDQTTTDSVVLTWQMIRYSHYKGLIYEIRIRPQNFDWLNWSDYDKRINKSEYKLKLRNLPYAYWNYTISLRLKLKTSRNDNTMWSDACIQKFHTMPRLPDSPPKTDVGSFYIDSTETRVSLYWQELPVYRQNGDNFKYIVTQVQRDGVVINFNAIKIDHTSAEFQWHKDHHHKFIIKSRNDVGESVNSTEINVPAMPKLNERKSPKWIRNIYHGRNSTYKLSWSPPDETEHLVDYTVFWCHSMRANPNQCNNSLQFTHIPKNITNFTTVVQDQTQNLAVSANYKNFSSGMHWTMCAADVSTDLAKLEPEISATSSRTILVQWSRGQVCTSLLEGYNLTYCRVDDTDNVTNKSSKCQYESTTITIEKTTKKQLITNLKPFTTYKFEMFMFSKLKTGKVSDAQLRKTYEEAPSSPRNLKIKNITSNSIYLTWEPPAETNGIIRFYTIWCSPRQNNEHQIVNCTESNDGRSICNKSTVDKINFRLQNLSSFTNYEVYVVAHTVDASVPSNSVNFKTLIGKPSKPRFMIEALNAGNHPKVMQWSEPEFPAGRVEFYEVKIATWHKNVLLRKRISGVVGSTSCAISMPNCIDSEYEHKLHVRAVNVASLSNEIDDLLFVSNSTKNEADYEGNDDLKCVGIVLPELQQFEAFIRYRKQFVIPSEWEEGPVYLCADTKLSRLTTIYALLGCVVVIGTSYFLRLKISKMSNIKCQLPADLTIPTISTYNGKPDGGVDNEIIEKDEDNVYCKELLNNNENLRLLSSVCNDMDYIRAAPNLREVSPSSLNTSSGYFGSTDNSERNCAQQESTAAKLDPNSAVHTGTSYMVMNMFKPNVKKISHTNEMLENTKPPSNVYVHPSGIVISTIAKPTTPNLSFVSSKSSYIKPNSLIAWQQETNTNNSIGTVGNTTQFPVNSNGYVPPQFLQNSSTQGGVTDEYTTIDALGKCTINPPMQINAIRRENVAEDSDRLPPISGYVTQKELSVFGQHQLS